MTITHVPIHDAALLRHAPHGCAPMTHCRRRDAGGHLACKGDKMRPSDSGKHFELGCICDGGRSLNSNQAQPADFAVPGAGSGRALCRRRGS